MADTFYITTPIYYPTDEPHIGHVYTTICADTVARYHRLRGDDTYLLTGTDEHGVKMVKKATEKGIEPGQLADQVAPVYEKVWRELDVQFDDFIRTTEVRHKVSAQKILEQFVANGDLYLGAYEGWYDEGQEQFITETDAKSREYKSEISGRPLVRYKEPTYFFRLSKYIPRVLEHIEKNPDFIRPVSRRNEVISKLKQGVEDLSVSRATLKWGIPLPNDSQHVLYVWVDALSNYISALGYGSSDESKFKKYWPANVHVIGKDILWFHAVYWPAMLMSLGVAPPKCVMAHGWFVSEGRKMSKMLGNFVDLEKIRATISKFGQDTFRYFLVRPTQFGEDPDWSDAKINECHNELGNIIGNCLNRVLTMVSKYRDGALPATGSPATLEPLDHELINRAEALGPALDEAYAKCALQECAVLPMELARATNGYIEATRPFSLAKDPAKASRLDTVLNVATQSIYRALLGLLPILPTKAAEGLQQLGVQTNGKNLSDLFTNALPTGHKLFAPSPLFPKIEEKK